MRAPGLEAELAVAVIASTGKLLGPESEPDCFLFFSLNLRSRIAFNIPVAQ